MSGVSFLGISVTWEGASAAPPQPPHRFGWNVAMDTVSSTSVPGLASRARLAASRTSRDGSRRGKRAADGSTALRPSPPWGMGGRASPARAGRGEPLAREGRPAPARPRAPPRLRPQSNGTAHGTHASRAPTSFLKTSPRCSKLSNMSNDAQAGESRTTSPGRAGRAGRVDRGLHRGRARLTGMPAAASAAPISRPVLADEDRVADAPARGLGERRRSPGPCPCRPRSARRARRSSRAP